MVHLGLLSASQDRAVWLAALASHLSYMDPANMCFIYCYGERVFDQFCNVEDPTLPDPQEKLLLALSCLLNPVIVHPTVAERYKVRDMLTLDLKSLTVRVLGERIVDP
jgi:hypothetical protein